MGAWADWRNIGGGGSVPLSPLCPQELVPGSAGLGGGNTDPVMLLLKDVSSCLTALEEHAGSSGTTGTIGCQPIPLSWQLSSRLSFGGLWLFSSI